MLAMALALATVHSLPHSTSGRYGGQRPTRHRACRRWPPAHESHGLQASKQRCAQAAPHPQKNEPCRSHLDGGILAAGHWLVQDDCEPELAVHLQSQRLVQTADTSGLIVRVIADPQEDHLTRSGRCDRLANRASWSARPCPRLQTSRLESVLRLAHCLRMNDSCGAVSSMPMRQLSTHHEAACDRQRPAPSAVLVAQGAAAALAIVAARSS